MSTPNGHHPLVPNLTWRDPHNKKFNGIILFVNLPQLSPSHPQSNVAWSPQKKFNQASNFTRYPHIPSILCGVVPTTQKSIPMHQMLWEPRLEIWEICRVMCIAFFKPIFMHQMLWDPPHGIGRWKGDNANEIFFSFFFSKDILVWLSLENSISLAFDKPFPLVRGLQHFLFCFLFFFSNKKGIQRRSIVVILH